MTLHDETLMEDPDEEEDIVLTEEKGTEDEEVQGFLCDKCPKPIPNNEAAMKLHMQRAHNIKTLQSTPRPASRSIKESSIEIKTRPSIKCNLCNFICKSKPSMKKHGEFFHKNRSEVCKTITRKRPMTSFNCPKCNSTFDNKNKMSKHNMEQHESKHVLSPRRKVPKTKESSKGKEYLNK